MSSNINYGIHSSHAYVGANSSSRLVDRLTALINSGEKTFQSDSASAASGARLASEVGKEMATKDVIKNGLSAITVGVGAIDSMLGSVNDAIAKAKEATDALMSGSDRNAIQNEVHGLGAIVNTLKNTAYEGNTLFDSSTFSIDGVSLGGSMANMVSIDFSNIAITNTTSANTAIGTLEGFRNSLVNAGQHFGNINNQLTAKLDNLDVTIQGLSEARAIRVELDLPALFTQLSDARFAQTQSSQFLVQDNGARRQIVGMFAQL